MIRRFLLFLIRGYKRFLSPLMGNNCRFIPTCSSYAMEAIEVHGALKGLGMSLWRILRCNPFCKGGYDPVPMKSRGKGTSH